MQTVHKNFEKEEPDRLTVLTRLFRLVVQNEFTVDTVHYDDTDATYLIFRRVGNKDTAEWVECKSYVKEKWPEIRSLLEVEMIVSMNWTDYILRETMLGVSVPDPYVIPGYASKLPEAPEPKPVELSTNGLKLKETLLSKQVGTGGYFTENELMNVRFLICQCYYNGEVAVTNNSVTFLDKTGEDRDTFVFGESAAEILNLDQMQSMDEDEQLESVHLSFQDSVRMNSMRYIITHAGDNIRNYKTNQVSKMNLALSDRIWRSPNEVSQITGVPLANVKKHLYSLKQGGVLLEHLASSGALEEEETIPMSEYKALQKQMDIASKSYDAIIEEWKKKPELAKEEGTSSFKKLVVERWDGKKVVFKDITLPKVFDQILELAECRRNILLVGPAGCGKTFIGQLLAKTLSMEFGTLNCTASTSEHHLVGRGNPNIKTGQSVFQTTEFLKRYEEGGVFLMDEVDAADPNVLLSLNSALANDFCNTPARLDEPHAKKHRDFICIATANTFGRGANRMYAGRNQLDEATIDRFRMGTVECYYDRGVEKKLCPDDDLREALQGLRKRIEDAGLRRLMSTRFIEDAYIMSSRKKWDLEKILEVFFQGWSDDELARVNESRRTA